MTATKLPIDVGKTVTPGTNDTGGLAKDLGNLYETVDGKMYRLVKAAAAIPSAGGLLVSTAYSAGVPTWSVNKTTTAKDSACVGAVPSAITSIASGDYFLVQVAGPASVQASATTITDGSKLVTTTAGQAVALAVTAAGDATDVLNAVGESTNTAAVTAAGELITADLRRVL